MEIYYRVDHVMSQLSQSIVDCYYHKYKHNIYAFITWHIYTSYSSEFQPKIPRFSASYKMLGLLKRFHSVGAFWVIGGVFKVLSYIYMVEIMVS